jgi:glutathione S-transferase
MNAVRETFTLQLQRFIRAPRDAVFNAFVQPELMAAWYGPRGMQVQVSADVRVGGAYRLQMQARDGTHFVASGHYVKLERPAHIAYTWSWEEGGPLPDGLSTLIEVELIEAVGGTELRMTHSGFPAAAARDGHGQGWASCFNKLTDLLDPRGTAATLRLLGDPRSSYVRTARMAFAEKGVAVTHETAPPHSAEILAVHPFGRIPVLMDGDLPIWETSAIVRFVDESFGDGPLLTPATIRHRVVCDQWVSAVNSYLYDTMVRRFVLQYLLPRGEQGQPDRVVIDAARRDMQPQLAALDRAWAGSDFLAGQSVSVADLFVAPILAGVASLPEGASLLSDFKNLRRAQAAMQQRDSFRSTAPNPAPASPTTTTTTPAT